MYIVGTFFGLDVDVTSNSTPTSAKVTASGFNPIVHQFVVRTCVATLGEYLSTKPEDFWKLRSARMASPQSSNRISETRIDSKIVVNTCASRQVDLLCYQPWHWDGLLCRSLTRAAA